jgi:predicted  nucleic acid-binding Zn-ribbon protein
VQFAILAQTGDHEERLFNKEIAKISKRGIWVQLEKQSGIKQKMQRALEQEITEVTEREKNSSKGAKHRTRKTEDGTRNGER